MGSPKNTYIADITLPDKQESRGKIVLRAEEIKRTNTEIELKVECESLKTTKKIFGFSGKDAPFFYLSRGREDHKSEMINIY